MMKYNKYHLCLETLTALFIASLLICFAISCSQVRKTQTNEEEQAAPSTNSESPIYPHSEEWSHGEYTINNSHYKDCYSCHDPKESDTVTCQSCHDSYPHDMDDWANKEQHGAYVYDKSINDCKLCHGDFFEGGNTKVSCFKCHDSYPHGDENWAVFSGHGLYTFSKGMAECKDCHGSDYTGGTSGVSCFTCHKTFPHEVTWVFPTKHGDYVLNNSYEGCQECHGTDYTGGYSGESCEKCHQSYPHDNDGWETVSGHGAYTLENGLSKCQKCHDDDYQGGNTNFSCFMCHDSYPHAWEDTTAHASAYLDNKSSCTTSCHGEDLAGGASGVSCKSCHTGYPHLSTWTEPASDTQWHGTVAQGDGVEACQDCHGADYTGGSSNVSCFSCHADYPHTETNWSEGVGHGYAFSSEYDSKTTETSCGNCHGYAVAFENEQTQELLQGQSECYNCHWAYPHIEHNGYSWLDVAEYGHALFVQTADLLIDETGYHPEIPISDPQGVPAVANTCGGATSTCHTDGYRPGNMDLTYNTCEYCHP
ncbi:hypothetical protein KKF63_00940 [bacterium]|nr:hypothetical protein [bacterium]